MDSTVLHAREVLHNIGGYDYDSCGNYPLERREAEKVINILNEFISKNIKSGWIPCKVRLPEENGRFLTYIENPYDGQLSYIIVCDYIGQTWCPDDETVSNNVIAWQPLPEPYKEESEGREEE